MRTLSEQTSVIKPHPSKTVVLIHLKDKRVVKTHHIVIRNYHVRLFESDGRYTESFGIREIRHIDSTVLEP